MGIRTSNEFFNKDFFTVQETASYLCRSEGVVRGLINSGYLPKIQTDKRCKIMIAVKDIIRFVEATKTRVLY